MKELKLYGNSIIITKDSLKNYLLKRFSNSLNDIKIITLTELRRKFYFDYNEQAIYYLMNKYGYQLDVSKMYIDRMYEVSDEVFNSSKIKKIMDLKKELAENKLLIYSDYFKEYLKSKNVIFYECINLDKFDINMLDEVSKLTTTTYVNMNNVIYSHNYIYQLDTIEDEVIYVALEICKLINEGVSPNKIKLCGVTGEYTNIIKRIFKWYNIPIVIEDNYLYQTAIVKDFLDNLDEDVSKTLSIIEEKYNLENPKIKDLYNKIISILNKYIWTNSYLKIKPFLERDFKNASNDCTHYEEEVKIISSLSNVGEDDCVFLLGFNQGEIPKTYKDESYFNDKLKIKLGLETSNELNRRLYSEWLLNINRTKNLIITTKLTSSLGVHYLSSLNDDLNLEIIKPKLNYNYSNLHNKLLLGEKIDSYIKYGEKASDLELLYSNYPGIPYLEYDNNYKRVNSDKLKSYLKNTLVLSYSSMNTYYQCGFRYYLANILRLNIFEESFYTILGNLFHYILSIYFKKEINIEEEYNNYLSKLNYNFNSREKFFLSNLVNDLKFIINTIEKHNEVTTLNNIYFEEKIEVDKSREDFTITFKGFVDKLMTNDNEDIVSIIDYKTGNPDLNLNNIIYGLDLQLPVYIYLAKKKFPKADIAGFYLQKILNNEISKDYKHTYEVLKEDKLKLQGYSNSNIAILDKFDKSYNESKMIKGMRTTSKGLGTKKILRNDQIEVLEDITEEKIEDAIDNIMSANFDINPKRVGMNNLGCKYCSFKDICFFKESNIKNLKEYKNMEFLGGDSDDTN